MQSIFSALLVLFGLTALGSAAPEVFRTHIKKGEATQLAQYFNSSIQIAVPGKKGVFSKSQAKMILKEFFENNTPKDAKITQSGNSANGAQYVQMTLTTDKTAFEININYRQSSSQTRIHELEVSK